MERDISEALEAMIDKHGLLHVVTALDKPIMIAKLDTVRELTEGEPVEIWINETGNLLVRAYNECGNGYTEIDLVQLVEWAKYGATVSPLWPPKSD